MPSINPSSPNGQSYTVSSSRGLVATLNVPLTNVQAREFTVDYPTGAPAIRVLLVRGAQQLDLLPGATTGLSNSTAFPGRQIDASTSQASASVTELYCQITATAGATTEQWEVRVTASSAGDYTLATPGSTVTRILCDPVVGITISSTPGFASGHTVETATVTLTAAGHSPAPQPTIVGSPAPSVTYRWTSTGPPALPGLPACATPGAQIVQFIAPTVAAMQTVQITQEAWYEGSCANVGWLTASTGPQPLVIEPRPTVTPNVHSTVGVDTWVRV